MNDNYSYYCILGVLDPRNNVQISIHDAVEAGIIDYSRGVYCNPRTAMSVSIPEAMVDGRIKVTYMSSLTFIANK